MARDFSKNASNYIALSGTRWGALVNGASAISVACWANVDTIGTGVNDNRLLSVVMGTSLAGMTLAIDGSGATKYLRVGGRSQAADSYQARNATSSFTTGTWHHCGGVFNLSGDTITPYFNGAAENSGAVTFGAASYTHSYTNGEDFVGAQTNASGQPVDTAQQLDGRVAEFAVWNVDIGAAGFASLAKGASPLQIKPESLVSYFPLHGVYSTEHDWVSGRTGTITGTVAKAVHPRIIYPRRKRFIYIPAAAPAGNRRRRVLLCGRAS